MRANDVHGARSFPTMKCAFSASDILFNYMGDSSPPHLVSQRLAVFLVIPHASAHIRVWLHQVQMFGEREMRHWLESSCCELLERYGETAQAAMSNEQSRQVL